MIYRGSSSNPEIPTSSNPEIPRLQDFSAAKIDPPVTVVHTVLRNAARPEGYAFVRLEGAGLYVFKHAVNLKDSIQVAMHKKHNILRYKLPKENVFFVARDTPLYQIVQNFTTNEEYIEFLKEHKVDLNETQLGEPSSRQFDPASVPTSSKFVSYGMIPYQHM